MATTFEGDSEYRDLRREVVKKTRTAAVIGGIGSLAIIGGGYLAAVASGIMSGGLAVGGASLLAPGVIVGAAIALAGAGLSYVAMKTNMEAQLDTQELDALRSAKHLQMAFGDKGQDVSRQEVLAYEALNRGRSDGKSWTEAEKERGLAFNEVSR